MARLCVKVGSLHANLTPPKLNVLILITSTVWVRQFFVELLKVTGVNQVWNHKIRIPFEWTNNYTSSWKSLYLNLNVFSFQTIHTPFLVISCTQIHVKSLTQAVVCTCWHRKWHDLRADNNALLPYLLWKLGYT